MGATTDHGKMMLGTAMAALVMATVPTTSFAAPQEAAAQAPAKPTRAERAAIRKAAREARRAERRRLRAAKAAGTRDTRIEGSPTVAGGDIIVTGLRQSVKDSIDRKRRARQIVDVVTAEDAGKLPDNNVVDAMARVTGVAVTRSQGRGNGFTIRGLAGVQTTVNGVEGATAPLPGGEGRTLALESVPAELVKSIEVYKTRTADQIEGGVGGSVNVELRRPLELRKGWTIAGSVRDQYAEQGKLWSPSASLLVANRMDTGIGEIGFLLNGAYAKQNYAEAANNSESPFLLGCDTCTIRQSLPEDQRDRLVAPFRAAYGTNNGRREQKSLSGAMQWRVSPKLNFVLEGSYFGETYTDQFNSIYALTRQDYYTIQNPRIAPSGVLLGYDVVNLGVRNPDGTVSVVNGGRVDAGFNAGQSQGSSNTYRTNFETHFESPGVRIDASAQYQWSNSQYYSNGQNGNYVGLNRFRVDFDSPKTQNNGPYFDFYNVDPVNPEQARVQALYDNLGEGRNSQFSAQVDIWKELDPSGLLRAAKFGARFAKNTNSFKDSYRYAGWFDTDRQIPLSNIPGVDTVVITPQLPGGSPVSWVQLDSGQLFNAFPALRQFIIANNPQGLDGPGRDAGVESLFGTVRPSAANTGNTSDNRENSFAAYAILDYAFKAGFPIDGNVGVRYVNTYNSINGRNLVPGPQAIDPVTRLPIPNEYGPDTFETQNLRGNYVDILPSAFATVHFTDKLQLRGSYSYNVQRPSLFALRNFFATDYRNPLATVYAGNPQLRPATTDDYNLSLEWYFGRGGIISFGAFSKIQNGFIFYTRQRENVPQLGGQARFVEKPRNSGPGKTQGFEAQATGFFSFLPGLLRNLGATVNATFIPVADISLPNPLPQQNENDPIVYEFVRRDAPFTSRWSYNLIGYYETPMFGVRVAYNWRSKFQTGEPSIDQIWTISSRPTQRLDAAITYTPFKFLTLSIEGSNLLGNIDKSFYYTYPELPVGLRAMGRTITGGARFRF
ncbi:TonB-dependent receptor [Sphingomonas adhaesiva]|uniref:TonB-dependent receptor n=1 Tax=Sphingomonas adhaesiva TaxID=28212 RepID=UPI002FF6DACD